MTFSIIKEPPEGKRGRWGRKRSRFGVKMGKESSISAQPHGRTFSARKSLQIGALCCAAVENKLCIMSRGVPFGLFDFCIATEELFFARTPCGRDICVQSRPKRLVVVNHAERFTSRQTRTCREVLLAIFVQETVCFVARSSRFSAWRLLIVRNRFPLEIYA